MKVGLGLPQVGAQATKQNLIQFARDAEREGFDSLWVGDRLLWPLKPQTPYAGTPDGSLPTEYQRMFDPLETLTFVAANTENITLGTAVIDMVFHNPIILARQFATLDILSEGRIVAGFGLGWSKDEYQASNVPFERKGKRADEFLKILQKAWTDDIVEFKGEFYNIPASIIGPKPIQKPHIPIYLGGFNQRAFSRIVDNNCNGWVGVITGPLFYLKNAIDILKEQISKANQEMNQFKIIVASFPAIVDSKSDFSTHNTKMNNRFPLTGSIDEIGDDMNELKRFGVDHIIFQFGFSPIGKDLNQVIDVSKQLLDLAR